MMIVADVNMDGSVAVMSGSPVVPSAMTLDTWLDIVKHRKKGIKLQFQSVQAVETTLRKLRQMQNSVNMHQLPLYLMKPSYWDLWGGQIGLEHF